MDRGTQGVDDLVDWTIFAQMRTELGASFVRILGYFREDGEKAVAKIEQAMHRRDAAAMVLPAHTLKAEARQFGAEPVADLAEEIENQARRALESHLFPDNILPQVARLRPLYGRTLDQLEQETNPLAVRRPAADRGPSNQDFGRL
jgi:HPt (histidine-containing phosphotransfer) domain-containing protein